MPTIRVGVDFGTTHTIVALVDDGNHPVLTLPFDYDGEPLASDQTPSCLTWFRDRFYYGPAALRCFYDHLDEAVLAPSIKRLLRDWQVGAVLKVGAEDHPVLDLLAGFLSAVRNAVLASLDLPEAVIETVIAVPANASSSQRFVTLEAFRRAGFQVLRILDEPVASGIQFVHERYKRWDRVQADVIIYDLGGGTFDTTLLSIDHGRYDPLRSQGISHLGGDDFDEMLLELVEARIGSSFSDRDRPRMRRVVREVKEGIGPYTQKLLVETPEGVAAVPIRAFHDAARPLIQKTIDLVDRVLTETKGRAEPDRIVLAGGGSLLAAIPKMLKERYGRARIHQGLYPLASVAIGAAIQAGSPGLTIEDRLTTHFGVLRVRNQGEEYLDVIFEKGQKRPGPGQAALVRRPPYDPRHNIGRFRYLECDDLNPNGPLPAGETVYWNEILFPYDRALNPAGRRAPDLGPADIVPADHLGHERIQEEYVLDEYGIVTARISRSIQDQYASCHNLFRRWPF
jgi:molecular chaperone DnaK (HSP70)